MVINLLNLIAKDDADKNFLVGHEANEIFVGADKYKVLNSNEFTLYVHHYKNHEISIKGECEVELEFFCDRCLVPVAKCVTILLEKEINLDAELEDDYTIEHSNYIDGYNLDIDKLLYNEILIGWPMKVLCDADCKGVCGICGQNLNKGVCDCEDTNLDPRMSVIRDVYKNFKEV